MRIYGNFGNVSSHSPNHTVSAAGHLAVYALFKKWSEDDIEKQAIGSVREILFFKKRHTKSKTEKNFIIFMAYFSCNNGDIP